MSPPQSAKIQSYIDHLETEGISRVKMYLVITGAYLIFWGPLFIVTLANENTYEGQLRQMFVIINLVYSLDSRVRHDAN